MLHLRGHEVALGTRLGRAHIIAGEARCTSARDLHLEHILRLVIVLITGKRMSLGRLMHGRLRVHHAHLIVHHRMGTLLVVHLTRNCRAIGALRQTRLAAILVRFDIRAVLILLRVKLLVADAHG